MKIPRSISHRPHSARRLSRPGWLLYELMFSLGLLALVGTLFTHLFRTAWKVTTDSQNVAMSSSRLDAVLGMMQQDIWGAKDISITGNSSLKLTEGDGRVVLWMTSYEGPLSRGEPPEQQKTWEDLTPGIQFAADSGIVHVSVPATQMSKEMQRSFVSEIILRNGEQP